MKVSLAAQTLSRSVAKALEYLRTEENNVYWNFANYVKAYNELLETKQKEKKSVTHRETNRESF